MRMSLMFAAVTLLTGIILFFIPFQPVPALWGAILAVAFVLINVVADKLRLWSGIAWIIVAGIIITLMLRGKSRVTNFVSRSPFSLSWLQSGIALRSSGRKISSVPDAPSGMPPVYHGFFPAA